MRAWKPIWLTMLALLTMAAPGRAAVRAGLGGFFWSLETPQANDLYGVVAAQPGSGGSGLLAVGDASTFLIRRSPIADASSQWLAGRGRRVSTDTRYRAVARSARTGLIGVAASDGAVLIGDGLTMRDHNVSTSALNAVAWFDTTKPVLAIGGSDGTALRYRTETGTFTPAELPTNLPAPNFRRIRALPNSAVGYAAAQITTPNGSYGVLLKTTNSGASWTRLANAPYVDDYVDVSFVSPTIGFALATSGGGAVYRTMDGGASWTFLHGVNMPMNAIVALDAERLIMVGDSGIMVSSGPNGFESIPEPVTGLSAPVALRDVDAAGAEAWAVGRGGVIFHSQNDGLSWEPIARGGALDASQLRPWNAIQYLSEKDVYLAGDGGTIRRSVNGGLTYDTVPTGVSGNLFALAAPGQRNAGQGVESATPGIATGAGRAVLSYDVTTGGWNTLGAIPSVDYHGVAMLPRGASAQAWVVGDGGTIVANSGASALWTAQGSGTSEALRAVHAVGYKGEPWVYAVGDNGAILRSQGGTTWQALTPFASFQLTTNLRGVYFRDALTGFVVGDSGLILRTEDAGETWSIRQAPTSANLHAVGALPADGSNVVYAVGENQTVLKSTDNGTSWALLPRPIPGQAGMELNFTYRAVRVTSGSRVYIAGDDGHRLRSTNGAATWTETDGQSGAAYTALAMSGAAAGLSVGNTGSGPTVAFTNGGFDGTQPGTLPTTAALYAADAVGDRVIVAGAAGTIADVAGASYSTGSAFTDTSCELRAAASPSPGHYVVTGGSEILYSTNSGAAWHAADFYNPYGPAVRFQAVGFEPPNVSGGAIGYAGGLIPGQNTPVLFQTLDSGKTWSAVTVPAGSESAGITALAVSTDTVLAAAANGAVYIRDGGAWRVERPLPNFPGPWLSLSVGDGRWYVGGANGRAARYPDADGNPVWQALNTGTTKDITGISGPPEAASGGSGTGGSGQSLRDDVRGVSMRPEGVLLTGTGGLALFGDLDQNTYINVTDVRSSLLSLSGGTIPDDDAYFFGDIFPPVPAPDILPGDGFLDIRDATRVARKTQGTD